MEIFYGIKINSYIEYENLNIKVGDSEIIILTRFREKFSYLNFYITMLYFIEKEWETEIDFGLFYNKNGNFKRMKIKSEFLSKVDHSNFLFLLEGGNHEAYYNANPDNITFLGIEFRYKNRLNDFSNEEELLKILKRIGIEKKKYFKLIE